MRLVEFAIRDDGDAHLKLVGGVSLAEAVDLAAEGPFLAGSMGPKIASAIKFVQDGGARASISSLDGAVDGLAGKTGRDSRAPRKRHTASLQQAS
jgi:carbamate kinase